MQLTDVITLLNGCQQFVLTTHINPDGDGLGSQLALGEYLISLGKYVRIVNCSSVPRHYRFLDSDALRIEEFDPAAHTETIRHADCIVILDTNQPGRLGIMETSVLQSPAVKIVIDHHLDKDNFADHYLVDESAAATGEIVYRLLKAAPEFTFTGRTAINLYTAIMTDTGSFRFPKTTAETHRIIADLLDLTVDPAQIHLEVYERGPAARLVLLGRSLSTLRMFHNGRLALMTATSDMFRETQTDLPETDGFVNYAMQIDGVVIGVFITEYNGSIKLSFRGRGDVWVNKFAQRFGGNGHQHAAGATASGGDLDAVIRRVLDLAGEFLPQ